MKRFLAVYTGSAEAMSQWQSLSPEQMRERQAAGVQAWHAWVERNKGALVDGGGPLGKTKRASRAGLADIRNNIAAYCIVQAASHDEAVAIFKDHPHFSILPGEGVEVMECMPVPGGP